MPKIEDSAVVLTLALETPVGTIRAQRTFVNAKVAHKTFCALLDQAETLADQDTKKPAQ